MSTVEDRLWAAMMLALSADTCASILAGRRVRAGNLDAFFLWRALRGQRLPDPEAYRIVSTDMLDAIVEAGPLNQTWPDIPRHLRPARYAA